MGSLSTQRQKKSLQVAMAAMASCLIIGNVGTARAQTSRGITQFNQSNLRLPALTITGVSMNTTDYLGLVETVMGLESQRVEIPTSSNTKTVIQTYAGTAVESVTLFDPATFSNSNPGTKVNNQGPSRSYPYICGAAAAGQAPNVASTYTDPGSGITVNTGPGEAPRNAAGQDVSQVTPGNSSPNPLAGDYLNPTIVSAGTQFARQPWLSSGSFGNGLPSTGPLQITPFTSSGYYPDCGG